MQQRAVAHVGVVGIMVVLVLRQPMRVEFYFLSESLNRSPEGLKAGF